MNDYERYNFNYYTKLPITICRISHIKGVKLTNF